MFCCIYQLKLSNVARVTVNVTNYTLRETKKMPKAIPEYVYSQREANILELLKTPSTIKDLSNILSLSYHAVRRHIKELELKGFVKQAPWPKDGSTVYILSRINEQSNAVTVRFGKKVCRIADIPEVCSSSPKLNDLGRILNALICHYMESLERQTRSFPTGRPNSSEIRSALLELRRSAIAVAELTDQLLNLPIWTDDNGAKAVEALNLIGWLPEVINKNASNTDVIIPLFDKLFPDASKKPS